MSFLRNKFNRVFCNKPSRTVSPFVKNSLYFCDREVHDPFFDCCLVAQEIEQVHSRDSGINSENCGSNFSAQGKFKRKKVKKRTKSSLSNRTLTSLSKVSPYSHICSNDLMLASAAFDNSSSQLGNTSSRSNLHLDAIQNLCDKFDGISITGMTPRLTKILPKIPEHDKKIINRMALKRSKEIARLEDSVIARKYWDAERNARENLINRQTAQLGNVLKVKREQETMETTKRIQMIANKQQMYLEQIKREIMAKQQRLMNRLRNSELKRELRRCERRQEELHKFETAAVNQQHTSLDEQLKKQECYSQLESRINRAGAMRNYFLNVYKRRIYVDNELEQAIHAANYEEAKKVEQFKIDMLKNKIHERDRKCFEFMQKKEQVLNESRNQARATAELRDIVRRSISPENYSFRGALMKLDRPLSNMSLYESSVKLG